MSPQRSGPPGRSSRRKPPAPQPQVHNLPSAVNTFVGREQEMAELTGALRTSRLITLTGGSGVGKTRLALQVGSAVATDYPQGVWLVDLASQCAGEQVAGAVAAAIGLQPDPGGDPLDSVVGYLRDRQMLLILDNCEHLIEACAALADRVLRSCPPVSILATSQQALAIAGERVQPLAPLPLPDPHQNAPEALASSHAVQLFCDRARATCPGFALTAENAGAVARICRRLDGVPLAIELAAARVTALSPAEIADRLDDRFALLGGGRRMAHARHQSLAAALQWSHDLLSPPQQALFRRLAVFAGGFSLEAAEHICAGGAVEGSVLDLVVDLVARSLVVADTVGSHTRYRLHQTPRAFAGVQLTQAGEQFSLRARHAQWFTALAERADTQLTGADQRRWLAVLDLEHDNMRAALGWCLNDGSSELALRLSGALVLFWRVRGHFREGRQWLERALAIGEGAPPAQRAKALWGVGFLALMEEHVAGAVPPLEQSLALYRDLADGQGIARSLLLLGNCRVFADLDEALTLLEESCDAATRAGDAWCLAHALALRGLAHVKKRDPATARPLLAQGIEVARAARDIQSLRIGLFVLGSLELRQGNLAAAEALLGEALGIVRQLGEPFGISVALAGLGELTMTRGDYARARQLLEQSVSMAGRTASLSLQLEPLCLLGNLAEVQGDAVGARTMFEAALSLAQPWGRSCAAALSGLARLSASAGDPGAATDLFGGALSLASAAGDDEGVASALFGLAQLARSEGRVDRAALLHTEALRMHAEMAHARRVAESLEAVAGLALEGGRSEEALRLLAAASSLRQAMGYSRPPAQQRVHEAEIDRCRTALRPDAFDDAWAQGAAMSWEEAVRYATRGRGSRPRGTTGWDSLTNVEREVVALVAQGLTNAEIGERLFISRRTVTTHLSHIYAKLDVGSRRELGAEALRRS